MNQQFITVRLARLLSPILRADWRLSRLKQLSILAKVLKDKDVVMIVMDAQVTSASLVPTLRFVLVGVMQEFGRMRKLSATFDSLSMHLKSCVLILMILSASVAKR